MMFVGAGFEVSCFCFGSRLFDTARKGFPAGSHRASTTRKRVN